MPAPLSPAALVPTPLPVEALAERARAALPALREGRCRLVVDGDRLVMQGGTLPDAESALLDALLDQHARLLQLGAALADAERTAQVQKALYAISDLAASDLDMDAMLLALHRVIGGLMYGENLFIALHRPETDEVEFLYYADTEEPDVRAADMPFRRLSDLEGTYTYRVFETGRALRGAPDEIDEQVGLPMRRVGPRSADWLGVPMLADGQVRGVLVVQAYVQRPRYTEADQALLGFVGSHILTALEHKRAQEELERRVELRTRELTAEVQARERGERLQRALYRIAELANSDLDTHAFFRTLQEIVGGFMPSRNFYVALIDETGQHFDFPYFADEFETNPGRTQAKTGVTAYVYHRARPFLVDLDTAGGRAAFEVVAATGAFAGTTPGPTKSWLGVPLLREGRAFGVLVVQSYTAGLVYSAADEELLTFIAHQVASTLERHQSAEALRRANAELEHRVGERTQALLEQIAVRERMEEQLKHQVLHDGLTGLPNRAYLREHLARAIKRLQRDPEARFALLFMDLDRFKIINDSAGHAVGDALLVEVAHRFSRSVRGPDMVARLGGDEFAILMDHVDGADDAVRLAQRVIAALSGPMEILGRTVFTGVSIGIAIGHERYDSPEDMLRDADIAMYRAKKSSDRRFEVFDEALHDKALALLELESDLRFAILRREFEPWLQPIVALDDGRILGWEALMRWRHPARGVLAPGAFLDVAEANGSLEAIDWLIFEQVFGLAPGLLDDGQYININVSPRHFRMGDFAARFIKRLEAHRVAPSQIRIEVTEGAFIGHQDRAGDTIDALARHGIKVALDDFGTGYSSLGYLHRFRLHTVKIDRSFIAAMSPGSAAIVSAIISLAKALNLEVVAEGIEDERQRAALLKLGCGIGQGWLFSKPQPPAHWSRGAA